ncbi:MAG: hypothetical protein HY926_08745 [Elusimicrobia bacterium]|nr:hypothetical protein [Elusimicrobiota bacterium]
MRRLVLTGILLLAVAPAAALGQPSVDLELDAYYTPLSMTLPFTAGADERDVEKAELKTYRDMFARALVPRFLVLEASVNPLPLAGVLIRRHASSFYEDTQLSPSTNLVKSLTAGFDEPWALTAFLGKVIDYSQGRKVVGHRQRGYVGYLATYGNTHILVNQLIPDHWVEAEAKVKGDQTTDNRRMKWSFRFGTKRHGNREILDTYYIGLRRDRTDFKKTRWSWLLSTALEYRIDFDHRDFQPVKHYLMAEKNWPLGRRKVVLSVGVGYLRRDAGNYLGGLAVRHGLAEEQLLLRPNLKF